MNLAALKPILSNLMGAGAYSELRLGEENPDFSEEGEKASFAPLPKKILWGVSEH